MNFDVDENTPKKFRTDVVLADKDSGEVYSNKIRFIYLVMPLFKKKEEECTTFLDCWIYNLKHMETLEKCLSRLSIRYSRDWQKSPTPRA